jgi:hypothetical protein
MGESMNQRRTDHYIAVEAQQHVGLVLLALQRDWDEEER